MNLIKLLNKNNVKTMLQYICMHFSEDHTLALHYSITVQEVTLE